MIELLVVIAIIAILAALIFPVFARAKAAAKKTACINNFKQVGSAIEMYMADHDDIFPFAIDAIDKFHPEIWDRYPEFRDQIPNMPLLAEALQPYIKSKDIFHCPADTGADTLDDQNWIDFKSSPSMYSTFGSSYYLRTEIAFKLFSSSRFQLPSAINVLFDANGHWHGNGDKVRLNEQGLFYLNKVKTYRYTTLFGDLHVKNITFDQLQDAWQTQLD